MGELSSWLRSIGVAGLRRAAVTWLRNDRDYYFVRGTAPDYGYSGTNLRFEYQGVVTPVDQAKLIFGYEHERPDYEYFGFGDIASAKANIDSVYALAVVKPLTGLAVTGGLRHDDHSQFGGATTFGANANSVISRDGDASSGQQRRDRPGPDPAPRARAPGW